MMPDRPATFLEPRTFMSAKSRSARPKVHAQVAVALFESLRALDLPEEILKEEDITLTMPRRLGLSQVVDAEMRRLQHLAKRGRRIESSTWEGLLSLVARRPDAAAVGRRAGLELAAMASGWVPRAPLSLALRGVARRCARVGKRLFKDPVFVRQGLADPAEGTKVRRPRIQMDPSSALAAQAEAFPDVVLPLLEGLLEGVTQQRSAFFLQREVAEASEPPRWLIQSVPSIEADPVEESGVNGSDAAELPAPSEDLDEGTPVLRSA
jgi:hypothetical protein